MLQLCQGWVKRKGQFNLGLTTLSLNFNLSGMLQHKTSMKFFDKQMVFDL